MFICEPCLALEHDEATVRFLMIRRPASVGPCEMCNTVDVCADVQTKNLL